MFLLNFELREGKTIVFSSYNKMYCTTIAKQLNAVDGGVYNEQDITEYTNVIYLFERDLVIPKLLADNYSVIYFDITKLVYTSEYWQYLDSNNKLLEELETLLPVDNKIRLFRQSLRLAI